MAPPNTTRPGFPEEVGDTEIHFGDGEIYQVHSRTLKYYSSLLKETVFQGRPNLPKPWTHKITPKYVLELRFDAGTSLYDLYRTKSHQYLGPEPIELLHQGDVDEETMDARCEVVEALKRVFQAMYHLYPPLNRESVQEKWDALLEVTDAASHLMCDGVVDLYVKNCLLEYQDEFLEDCERDPFSALGTSIELKSKWLFLESTTHVLGMDEHAFDRDFWLFDESAEIMSSMRARRLDFEDMLESYERELFRIPAPLNGNGEEDAYCNVAIESLRNFLVMMLHFEYGSTLGPEYALLYRLLGTGNVSVLQPLAELLLVHVDENGNHGTMAELRPYLQDVMNQASAIVQPLLVDKTKLQRPPPSRPSATAVEAAGSEHSTTSSATTDDVGSDNVTIGDTTTADDTSDEDEDGSAMSQLFNDPMVRYFNRPLTSMELTEDALPWMKGEESD